MVILSDAFWLPKIEFGNRFNVIIIWLDSTKKRSDAFWLPEMQFGNRLDAIVIWLDTIIIWLDAIIIRLVIY